MNEWANEKWEQFQNLYNDALKKYEAKVSEFEEREKKFPGFEETEIGKRMRESLNKFSGQVETWRKQIEVAGKKVEEITVHKKTWESKQGEYKALQGQIGEIKSMAKEADSKNWGDPHVELEQEVKAIDASAGAGDFKKAVEKLDRAVEFSKELVIRLKKALEEEDDNKLDPSDAKQIQKDIDLIQKGFKVFEDAGGSIPNWISGPIRVLKIAVDTSVDVLDAIEEASAALRKYNQAALQDAENLPDKPVTMDEFHQQGVDMAARDRQWLAQNVKFTLGWDNPESVTSVFVKKTVERYAPDYIANNWDKIAQTLR